MPVYCRIMSYGRRRKSHGHRNESNSEKERRCAEFHGFLEPRDEEHVAIDGPGRPAGTVLSSRDFIARPDRCGAKADAD